jgi:predicted permease
MRAPDILKLRLRTLFHRDRLDRELDEEVQYHLDREIQRNLEAGMPSSRARTAAVRSMGRAAQIQEQCRDERRVAWITDTLRDLRYGLRSFRREPVFVIAIVATLGLGIGANTAVFSVADALLLKGLPVHEPERLFQVLQPDGPGLQEYGELFAAADFAGMRDRVGQFAQLAAETEARQVTATIEGAQAEVLSRGTVSGNYFPVLGVEAAFGRTISADDDRAPGRPPAAIGYGFWKRRFDLNPQIVGRTIRIGNTIFQIIGVAQPGFLGIEAGKTTDVWTPLAREPQRPRSARSVRLIGRLNPGATMVQASDPLQAIFHQQLADMVGHAPPGTPQPLIDRILQLKIKLISASGGVSPFRAGAGKPLLIVFGLVALVLIVACTTVATLFEARRGVRQREMAVRMSMGASRWRLLRQLLCEALLIAGAAAAFGLILAHWMRPVLLSLLAPSGEPVQFAVGIDGRVLAFTALLCILTALLFGLAPAWRSSSVNPIVTLKSGGGRTISVRSSAGKVMVAFQVAISLVLVLGATLFVRTLINLSTMDTGFDRRNIILADVRFRGADRSERLSLAWKELERRVSAIPGVESVSLSSGSPFNGSFGNGMLRLPGVPVDMKNSGCVFFLASAGFFKTTGIALLEGRDFEPRDFDPTAAPVAVVSESLARQLFRDSNPAGRTFSNFEDNPPRWVTVIGVVNDIKFESLRNSSPRVVYSPFTWPHPVSAMSLVLRARRDVTSLGAALRHEASAANPDFAVRQITTQTKMIDDTLVRERLLATVAGFFGVLALLMAVIGLYGITSYTVMQRTPEIGIRMALGAAQGTVLRMILRESALVVTVGAAMGLAVALAAERLVAALLFGAKAYDPATIAATIAFVLVMTVVAALIPARRAAKTDPVVALRYE